jgi:23S rRNA pseudouridine1911/1915/1917 synthase
VGLESLVEEIDEICPDALSGQRVDRIVSLIAEISRSAAADLIAAGAVSVDGEVVAKPSSRMAEGSRIRFVHDRPPSGVEADPTVPVTVLYADDEVIVVDKPAGLVVHPGAGTHRHTLANGLIAWFPELAEVGVADRPGIVHRLDKGTSGVLMVARTSRAHTHLTAQLAARSVERRYRALALGHLGADRGRIDAPLGRSPRDPATRAVIVGGRPARTGYEVVRRGHLRPSELTCPRGGDRAPGEETCPQGGDRAPGEGTSADGDGDVADVAVTELVCRLETGRTHQIRAHLAAIDHPIYADATYGGRPPTPLASSETLSRPFLHAELLGFDHPRSGERLQFASPLPADLAEVSDRVVASG